MSVAESVFPWDARMPSAAASTGVRQQVHAWTSPSTPSMASAATISLRDLADPITMWRFTTDRIEIPHMRLAWCEPLTEGRFRMPQQADTQTRLLEQIAPPPDADGWLPVAEAVTAADIAELDRIWALPLAPDAGIVFPDDE